MDCPNGVSPRPYIDCIVNTSFTTATPSWLDKGDNAWQMTAATFVGIQSVPGLVIMYGGMVKKKWAVNSAFMAFYAFAASLIVWVLWGYQMAFGPHLVPFWGKAGVALSHDFLLSQATIPESAMIKNGSIYNTYVISGAPLFFPTATMVYFQFVFAAIAVILVAGSLLGRMNFQAWMLFVPLWVTFSYTVGAFSLFGGGFLAQRGVIDYSGGYVIHLSSGAAGFTAAYWVGPRLKEDRENNPPNSLLLMLAGAGLLWLGWTGFNGGDPYAANIDASLAVLNTHICAATSLLVWLFLDSMYSKKPSVIGAVQGMVTGLVCITPAAGVVEGWAAMVMGLLSGSIPWYTMMILHKRSSFLMKVDDVMAGFHTHAVAGTMGGILTGLFAKPQLTNLFSSIQNERGLFSIYLNWRSCKQGLSQVSYQLAGAVFIATWNVVVTTVICNAIRLIVPLRLSEKQLRIGDAAAHGEEAYALSNDAAADAAPGTEQPQRNSSSDVNQDHQGSTTGVELEIMPEGTADPADSLHLHTP